MTVYVDPDDLKKTLTLDGTTFRDDDIDLAVVAASGQVERMTNRDFGKSTEDEVRYYTAHDSCRLRVHDILTVTTIETDEDEDGTFETLWSASDFLLRPFNAVIDGEPFTDIVVRRSGGTNRFPVNVARGVKVTGIWGWASPPTQIVEVAGIIATQLIKRKVDAPFGFVIGPESAAYIAGSDPTIKGQLHDLNRKKLISE